jgi:hypothetical protein
MTKTRIDPGITGNLCAAARLAGGITGRGGNAPLTNIVVAGAAGQTLISR